MNKYTEIKDTNEGQMLTDVQIINEKYKTGDSVIIFHIETSENEKAHICSSAGAVNSGHLASFLETALEVVYSSLNDLANISPDTALAELDDIQKVMKEWSE